MELEKNGDLSFEVQKTMLEEENGIWSWLPPSLLPSDHPPPSPSTTPSFTPYVSLEVLFPLLMFIYYFFIHYFPIFTYLNINKNK